MPSRGRPQFGLRFNLRSTLAPPAQTRVEESSGLLCTPISATANAAVPCALSGVARSAELARLNLQSAVRPMGGSVSSLNVSVAASVCLFEAGRQRRLVGGTADK